METSSLKPTEGGPLGHGDDAADEQTRVEGADTPPPVEEKKPKRGGGGAKPKEDKEKPAQAKPAKAGGEFAALRMGLFVHFVLTPQGEAVKQPEDRLLLITQVVNAKKGIISGMVFPHAGDFHKNVNPGMYMGVQNCPFHPGPAGEGADKVLVPGTWHFAEE